MTDFIDNWLNRLTMYRLTLYVLIALVAGAVLASIVHLVPYSPLDIISSSLLATAFGYLANRLFAWLFHAPTNIESVYITVLILVLILPPQLPRDLSFLLLAVVLAMASKYLLTVDKQHLFNPAAVAVVIATELFPNHGATWWVGTPALLPIVLIGGYLIIRKMERESMVGLFLAIVLLLVGGGAVIHGGLSELEIVWRQSLLHSAIFFFAFLMLTEPATAPGTNQSRLIYTTLTALLYSTLQLRPFGFSLTPEETLSLANLGTYFFYPHYRFQLPLLRRENLTKDTVLFSFSRPEQFQFTPGQYMEWTLPHPQTDQRGNRRYFSLASSPTEKELRLLVKFYSPSSSYKRALWQLQLGQSLVATHLAGDFTLPKNPAIPLVFIAGGVGIAPFESMFEWLLTKGEKRDIVLVYSNKTANDIVFAEMLKQVSTVGVRTIETLTDYSNVPAGWTGQIGVVSADLIQRNIPDFARRTFYLSGPQPMVQAIEHELRRLRLPKKQTRTDYFPGYLDNS